MEPATSTAAPASSSTQAPGARFRLGRYERWLLAIFLVSLPFVNPWVHGDGVGYYAYARSMLIEHRLDFAPDWKSADQEFRKAHTDSEGHIPQVDFTPTGQVNNHFAIGPAILWAPFLLGAHATVGLVDTFGMHIPTDGFSRPYLIAMAFATALYGFLGLCLSFQLARRYVGARFAFVATVGIWAASSLAMYMYFNPSWSHAQSAFVAALFLWYWNSTRSGRNTRQWMILGLIAGLVLDVYYISAAILLFPFLESLAQYRRLLSSEPRDNIGRLFLRNVVFVCALLIAFLPTLITKKIIYGSYLNFGYTERWSWNSPAFFKVAFSSDHGLFCWTPILILSVAGLFVLYKRERILALYSLAAFGVFWYAIGCYQDWDGLSSFGNRFFISLTPIFVIGLAALFEWWARVWHPRRAFAIAAASTALLILWNFGMMYQWGMHLVPVRGPISWGEAVHNQFAVVPSHAARDLERYFLRRGKLMQHIETIDVRQLKARSR